MKKNYLKKIGALLTLVLGFACNSWAEEQETTYPFQLSTVNGENFEDGQMHWYALTIRGAYVTYDKNETEKIPTSTNTKDLTENFLWAFVKENDGRIKVYNKIAGSTKVLGVNNNKVCMTDSYSWGYKNESQYHGFSFSTIGNDKNKINKNGSRNFLELWNGMDEGSVLNVIPEKDIIYTNKYYRIRAKNSQKYMSSEDSNDKFQELVEKSASKNTIFYLNHESRLIGCTGKFLAGGKTAQDLGFTISFIRGGVTEDGQTYYRIKPSGSNFLYDHSSKTGRVDVWSDPSTANGKCDWILEEVNPAEETGKMPALTKDVESYATLAAPMALSIPEGVSAYTAKVDGSVAHLTKIAEGTIPAGVPVILKNDKGQKASFNFTFAANIESENNENDLCGVFVNTRLTEQPYILSNGEKGIGFYKASDYTTVDLGANKAYLPASALTPDAQHAKGITLSFDGNGDGTTGIESTITDKNQKEEYYDLQGRRVMQPTKGIYVTKSGKKVLF